MCSSDLLPHVVEAGAGSPVVMVHGSFATPSTWKKLMAHLATQHHCIAISLPGHGHMPAPHEAQGPSLQPELDALAEVVQARTQGPIHLVGHSFGGVVALAQALRGNLALAQLTLFEPVATWVLDTVNDAPMQAQVAAFVQRYRRDAALGLPDVCGQVIDFWGGANDYAGLPPHIRTLMGSMVSANLRHWDLCEQARHPADALRQLTVPTRLVCGTRSNAVAHAIVNHLHQLLPHSRRWTIEGASHGLVASHAEACLDALLSPV